MGVLDRFRRPPSPHDGLSWPQLKARAVEALRAQTAAHDGWGIRTADWAVDLVAGTITFSGPEVVATAPVQVVGTLAPTGSWLWGWDHPSVRDGLDEHAALVRAYGERQRIDALTTRMLSATESEAWEYAAVAALLGAAQGAYRGTSGETAVFFTFGSVTLSKADGATASTTESATSQHAPVVATAGNPSPELIGPAAGFPTPDRTPQLSGPEPDVGADEVISFVHDYFREMHPTYHQEAGAEVDWDVQERLWDRQDAIRARHWRRHDDFFMGGVSSNCGRYNLDATRDWVAQRIAPRLWQVNWVNEHSTLAHCGLLVMAFDDGLRIVDELYDAPG